MFHLDSRENNVWVLRQDTDKRVGNSQELKSRKVGRVRRFGKVRRVTREGSLYIAITKQCTPHISWNDDYNNARELGLG